MLAAVRPVLMMTGPFARRRRVNVRALDGRARRISRQLKCIVARRGGDSAARAACHVELDLHGAPWPLASVPTMGASFDGLRDVVR